MSDVSDEQRALAEANDLIRYLLANYGPRETRTEAEKRALLSEVEDVALYYFGENRRSQIRVEPDYTLAIVSPGPGPA